ncbi:aminotransferase [Bacteroides sp. CAG:98]|nr:aminotransferase [Bacteroides sp. CAG:98]
MQKEHQPYNIQPADRLANVSEYYFSRKLKEVAQMNAEGKNVISLGIGSPDMPPSEETVNVLCEQAKRPDAHGYQPTVGIPELRKAMADWYKRWYHVELDPATEIQPLIGSKEGILHVTLALVNPGDQVLVPNPGYPTYTSLNKILGSEIVNYNLREDNHWQPDFDELEKMDLSRVKIMWTNYPNMPTGANATMELYEKLVNFARRHNIVIVNDNPYSFILNKKPLSILNVPGAKECCIEFNSMSKSHNMPGWRVGMLATNAQFVQWILKIKSNIDARRHNIVIVNDNPYSFILNKKPLSILNVPGAKECCIEFNSMSKSHNMPGWRVGMLATNAQFIQWILKIKSNIDSGTFRPMQLAAAQAYNNSVEWHEEANINVYSRRRQLAEEIMKVLGCSFDPNQVGMFLWGRIPESYNDVEELTEKVLHEARVFITPGFIFGSNGKRYIRISLCAKEEKLAEALERIKKIM